MAAEDAMGSIEHVGDSYSIWYKSIEYFLSRLPDALMVGRVENLDSHFSHLRNILNLPPQTELPESDEKTHRNPYSELDTHLDSEARHNLKNWYSEDYTFLDLCEENDNRLSHNLPESK